METNMRPTVLGSYSSYSGLRKRERLENDHQHYQRHVIIFGLAWIHDDHLVACTSHGEVVVWNVGQSTQPVFRKRVAPGKLYSIEFVDHVHVADKSLLVVSGDDGILMFDWKDLLLNQSSLSPIARFKPHPSPTEKKGVEINCFQVHNGQYLFGAAGDSFGVYKWDLYTGQLVANYSSADNKSIYALHMLTSPGACSTLLVGGEGERLQLWDANQDQCIGTIDVADANNNNNNNNKSTNNRNNKNASSTKWISSIASHDPEWFTVAGGSTTGKMAATTSGFLATYHARSRSLVAWTETREIPQHLASADPQCLVCVANEGVVTHYNALSLERTKRQWCTPPSSYAAAVSGKYTAVAGVGCFVDVFDVDGEKSKQLTIC
jgi:hypothetical protein